jgi:hypothetical protein
MQTHLATVFSGQLKLDEPLPLPDNSRVAVTVEVQSPQASNPLAALEAWRSYVDAHPVNSGGLRFTREELHERR